MASYNRVILMGNLTRDVELRYTPSGTAVTDVTVAVNDRRKNSAGEWADEVTFVDVTLWGRTAEVAAEYLGKGSPIFLEGRLKLDTWEKDGQKNYKLRVVCDRMQLVGGRDGGGGSPQSSEPRPAQQSGQQQPAPQPQSAPPAQREAQPTGEGAGYDDGDIPF